jgi:hypothetical protein
MSAFITKSISYGIGAALILLAIYFLILTFVSGWAFAGSQFIDYCYFIVSLGIVFGLQIFLLQYIKR